MRFRWNRIWWSNITRVSLASLRAGEVVPAASQPDSFRPCQIRCAERLPLTSAQLILCLGCDNSLHLVVKTRY